MHATFNNSTKSIELFRNIMNIKYFTSFIFAKKHCPEADKQE